MFAPEMAAHASGTSALLPMLALGITGSGTAAILLSGLMVWGLNPGPLLFVDRGLVLVLRSILRVPYAFVAPMIDRLDALLKLADRQPAGLIRSGKQRRTSHIAEPYAVVQVKSIGWPRARIW